MKIGLFFFYFHWQERFGSCGAIFPLKGVIMDNYFSKQYFGDAMRVYAICSDENISDDDTRVLAYMHAKGFESGRGIDYFANPSKIEEDALEIMVGDVVIADTVNADGVEHRVDHSILEDFPNYVRSIDSKLHESCGMENRISGELRRRLRLYKDPGFRARMMAAYSEKIAPKIYSYTKDDVNRSFARYRERKVTEDNDLASMLGE